MRLVSMRRALIIGLISCTAAFCFVAVWQYWYVPRRELAQSQLAREQWLLSTKASLSEAANPTAVTMPLPEGEDWAALDVIRFSDGWARFACHTFHDSERIGDIALLRASDGTFYISDFHFCVGILEYSQQLLELAKRQPPPKNIGHFIEQYGPVHGWKKL